MEDVREKKMSLRKEMEKTIASLSKEEIKEKCRQIERQLFDFANFQESEVILFYISKGIEVSTRRMLKQLKETRKGVVLPVFNEGKNTPRLFKVTDLDSDLRQGRNHLLEPDPDRCKPFSAESIELAIIPGIAFDEKGGRLGVGDGHYDRLIPLLPNTSRKVAFAFEEQIVPQVPMESHDKFVDIIITETRIIYKI